MHRACDSQSLGDPAGDGVETGSVYTSEGYAAILHSPIKEHLSSVFKDARLLYFITATGNVDSPNLQLLEYTITVAVTGM